MTSERHKDHLKQYLKAHKSGSLSANRKPSASHNARTQSESLTTNNAKQTPSESQPGHSPTKASHTKTHQKTPAEMSARKKTFPRQMVTKKMTKRNPTMEGMPNEILLHIFEYLDANDLMVAALVCSRWRYLADDNVMWHRLYKQHAPVLKKGYKLGDCPINPSAAYWKTLCIKSCSEARNRKIMALMKKIHPFTGLPAQTDKAVKQSGIRWRIGLVDRDSVEHFIGHKDVFNFAMSTCVRWYGLELPPVGRLAKLNVYAASPVFFSKKGDVHANSPYQMSLLYTREFDWRKIMSDYPVAVADENINIRVIPPLIVATWKDGGELAFITACMHDNQLVYRCLHGNRTRMKNLSHLRKKDDIDSTKGLHDYNCTVELRIQRTSFWSQQFRNLYCRPEDLGGGVALLRLISRDKSYEHSPIPKKISFNWKTDLFKGIVQDLCVLDLTLLDEHGEAVWCTSAPVKVQHPKNMLVNYDYDGEHHIIEYADSQGKVQLVMVWEEEIGQYMITELDINLSLTFVNQLFGTTYS